MREPEAFQERSDLDSFNVSRSWLRVWSATVRHKWLVLAMMLATLGLVVVYIYVWPPIYKGEVYFQVEREEDTARDKFYSDWSPFRKDDIESETSLMISGVILEEVANDLDLSYDDVYHSFMSWTQHLWRQSWPGKKYREVKEYFFAPKKSKWDLTDAQLEKGKVLSDFKDGVSIGRLGQSYVGVLVVKASTPRATEMANKLFDTYLKRRLERHSNEANRAFETLSSETELCRAALEAKENEMVVFSQKHELLIDFEREKLEVKQWIDMRQSILDTQIAVATSEARLRELDRFLAFEQPSVTGTRSYERSMVKRELELTRLHYETDLQDKLNRYTPESPEVTELKRDIESITKRIDATEDTVPVGHTDVLNASLESMRATRNEVFASLAGARASLAFKEKNEQELGARLKALPAVKQEFTLLARSIQLMQGKYADLNSRLVQANVSKTTVAATMPSLRVVEYARPTDAPDWPRTKLLILAGLGVGLLLGIGAAILRDLYLDEVRIEDLAEARGDGQFYARIHVGSNRRRFDLERTSAARRPRSFARRNGSGNGRGNGSGSRSQREDSDS